MEDNDPNNETLLPCPFCDAEPILVKCDDRGHCVACSRCNAGTRIHYSLGADGKETVIALWNSRRGGHGSAARETTAEESSSARANGSASEPEGAELEEACALLRHGVKYLSYRARDKWEKDVETFLARISAAQTQNVGSELRP